MEEYPFFPVVLEMGVKVAATFLLIPFTGYYGICFVEPIAWTIMGPFLCYFFYHDLRKNGSTEFKKLNKLNYILYGTRCVPFLLIP